MELAIVLNPDSYEPLHAQLYAGIRNAILEGELAPGDRIPSTRELSVSLDVSRTTVTLGYERLISEGYLEASRGSGTYVSKRLPEDLLQTDAEKSPGAGVENRKLRLSSYGSKLSNFDPWEKIDPRIVVRFRHGRPDYSAFPMTIWRRLLLRHCRSINASMLDYAEDSMGYGPLREAIAKYVSRSRAVRCSASQVVIVNGSQQAIDLVARATLNPHDVVAMENPGYTGAFRAFEAQNANLLPVGVDESGIKVSDLERSKRKFKLIYVTPSHQFPTGFVLSLSRRLELLDLASRKHAYIIEDDYDSEYRYEGRPLPALQGLDETGSVLYVGTLSKVMFPALRLGYVIVPEALARILDRAKWASDRQASLLEQYALNDFLREGHLERHLRRMRTLYDGRRRTLVKALWKYFGDSIRIQGENAGMHLMIRIDTKMNSDEVVRRAAKAGVGIIHSKRYYLKNSPANEFILAYANLHETQIVDGIRRFASVL